MSYIINNSRGNVLAVVADGTINTSATDLTLVGRAVTDYGTYENENYVYLLENFAKPTAPLQPILGQLWYNSSTDIISAYNSANTWTALATQNYVEAQKVSPVFTGTPTAPTAPIGTANAQIATTAFVSTSPQFTGVPTAPTAASGTATTQLATTAFVTNSPQFAGVPTAPTAPIGTSNTQIATTAFVSTSPQFTGIPTAPTASSGTSNTQIATTAFVQAQKISPTFTGTPRAPSAVDTDNSTQIATTAFVQSQKISPQFTGIPTAPTASAGTATSQVATTAFVYNELASGGGGALKTMAYQNANNVTITGGSIIGITPLPLASGGTSASSAPEARNNLGLGTLATQDKNTVEITGGTITGITPLGIAAGGTGGNTVSSARTSLGIGSLASQSSSNVAITGGTITGITPLGIAAGGTGGGDVNAARTNLGLGNIATQNASNVLIQGGNIGNVYLANLMSALAITEGGTGARNSFDARFNLGLGDMATQYSDEVVITGGSLANISVAIIGGSIENVAPIALNSGGTGAANAAGARTNLELKSGAITDVGTIATQNANSVTITGGNISGVTVTSLTQALAISSGGTGATTAANAIVNLGAVPLFREINTYGGLTGGGNLRQNLDLRIATNSNGYGVRYISTGEPRSTDGANGDIWYQV